MVKHKRKVVVIALAAALATPLSASAVTVSVSNLPAAASTIASAVSAAASYISNMVSSGTATLYAGLLSLSSQNHADMERQNTVNKAIAESVVDAQHQYKYQEHAQEINRQFADESTSCQAMAIGEKLTSANDVVRDSVRKVSSEALKRTTLTESQPNVVSQQIKTHNENFCSDDDRARGRCGSAAPSDMQNADLQASTFFTPKANMTYSAKEELAAKEYMNGLVNPLPTQALPVAWEKTPQGKAYIAAQMIEQRRLDIANNSLAEMFSLRKPQSNLGSLTGAGNGDMSMMGVIQYYASRFLSPAWHDELGASGSQEMILKGQSRMMAFKLYLDYKNYQQMERIEAILATQLSIQAKQNSDALLAQQRVAATNASVGRR